jgi:hypothetical protein
MRFLFLLAILCMAMSAYAYEVTLLRSPESPTVHCDDLSSDLQLHEFLEPLLTRKNTATLNKKVPIVDFVNPPQAVKVLFIEDVLDKSQLAPYQCTSSHLQGHNQAIFELFSSLSSSSSAPCFSNALHACEAVVDNKALHTPEDAFIHATSPKVFVDTLPTFLEEHPATTLVLVSLSPSDHRAPSFLHDQPLGGEAGHRFLASSNNTNSTGPTEEEIAEYQIVVWTVIGLGVVTFVAIAMVWELEGSKGDMLLNAKFQTMNSNKRD